MQKQRPAQQPGGQRRRDRRIAPHADNQRRAIAQQQDQRAQRRGQQQRQRRQLAQRAAAAQAAHGQHVQGNIRRAHHPRLQAAARADPAQPVAALAQHSGERERRVDMPAGAAREQHNQGRGPGRGQGGGRAHRRGPGEASSSRATRRTMPSSAQALTRLVPP